MKAKYVLHVTVMDPDTNELVDIDIYKEEAGGMFGIDSSYMEHVYSDETSIQSVFGNGPLTLNDDETPQD